MNKPFFPMFVNLNDKRALVVGGGRIAGRRVRTLQMFCDDITVVAPEISPGIAGVKLVRRAFVPGDLDGVDIALACTDDAALNAEIVRMCRSRGIPVNAASDRALCDFYFPGVAVGGGVTVGITASGEDHALAKRATLHLRRALEEME